MNREKLVNELKEMGLKIVDGKIKKSEIKACLQKISQPKMISVSEIEKICPDCANQMKEMGLEKIEASILQNAITAARNHNFTLADGTRPIVEDLIDALEEYVRTAKSEIDPESWKALESATKQDIAALKSILGKLSVV